MKKIVLVGILTVCCVSCASTPPQPSDVLIIKKVQAPYYPELQQRSKSTKYINWVFEALLDGWGAPPFPK